MCGIVGIYIKNQNLKTKLGSYLEPMLVELTDRGPDSAGVALYRNSTDAGWVKITLYTVAENYDWSELGKSIETEFDVQVSLEVRHNHCVILTNAVSTTLIFWLKQNFNEIRVVSTGSSIEIYKGIGSPREIINAFGIHDFDGSHALGHTRMATESAITVEHSHPFSTGDDLCLVHNGSMSNHNRMRQWLRRHTDIEFETDNDTEVAAGYFTYRLSEGASLKEALEAGLKDLDGFYTFAIGTKRGFAVMRDPIAAKPAVLAETDDWVAIASEFRSIATLPGASNANIWEPAPATMYTWGDS